MIQSEYFFINVIALTLGTILIRGSFISLSGKLVISPKVRELFTYIPAAILPALILPATFYFKGHVGFLDGNERFLVILITFVVAYFVRNTLFIVSFGLALLYLLKLA